jgi:pimeloyl-ACP methyl ester carboxylesterase
MQEAIANLPRPGRGSIAYRRRAGAKNAAGTDARPGLMFLGGFMSDMEGTKAQWLEGFAAARGLPSLRFDYSGHGRSEGAFTDGTIGAWLDDALDVFDQLTEGPQVLAGSSMGGWIALLLALRRPERVRGIVGIAAAPDFTEDLIHRELDDAQRATLMRDGILHLASEYSETPYPITRQLIEEGRNHLLLDAPIAVSCPLHLVHGRMDSDVPWQTATRIAEKIAHPDVAITFIDDGDHRLSRQQDLARIGAALDDVIGSGFRG